MRLLLNMHNNYVNLKGELEEKFPNSIILENELMSRHTTFKIGGPADLYVEPSFLEIGEIINFLKEKAIPFMVIGNGSNLLVSDDGIEGVVISLGKNASEISVDGSVICAQAGAMLSAVANTAYKNSLTGMEFAAGIPGSLGGAVYMNAGAYGGEIKDILISAQILTKDGRILTMSAEDLELSYRHSILMKEGGIVLSATLSLQQGKQADIRAVMDDLKEKRITKQPLNYPSAGSTFKRPEGYFAGKLIEDAGLKGYTVGGAQVSEKHSGFVVNIGGATAADVIKLMQDVDAKVYKDNNVHLEPEVRIIGRNI